MSDQLEKAYLYDGSLEGLFSAVFLAYERKEAPADVVEAHAYRPRLGQEAVEVETYMDRAMRVRDGIVRACGEKSYEAIKAVFLSDDCAKGAVILRFVRYAMRRGERALFEVAHPSVADFVRINRAVYNERHRWQQFMRFSKVEGGVYVARCNPNASVVPLLMDWFAGRFNTQPFLIFDEVHGVAGVSNGGDWRLVRTESLDVPGQTAEDAYFEKAWKTFYDTIAVEARYNPELRRQFMPKRFWRNIVEVADVLPSPSSSGKPCSSLPRLPR